MSFSSKERLGEILVRAGIISAAQLSEALALQSGQPLLLGKLLLQAGAISDEKQVLPFVATQWQVEYRLWSDWPKTDEAARSIPSLVASFYPVFALASLESYLIVATTRPWDFGIVDHLTQVTGQRIKMVLAAEDDIRQAIRERYGIGAETLDAMIAEKYSSLTEDSILAGVTEPDDEASVSKLFHQILLQAARQRATDIHLEPFAGTLKVRYRIDGILEEAGVPEGIAHFQDAINVRIKILAGLNIAEKRVPQDGRFKIAVNSLDLDLRVSFIPTAFGEAVVIRLLSSRILCDQQSLGLDSTQAEMMTRLLERPHGIIFVTGPTGCGKTTTLYSCLTNLNHLDKKIITVEDPVEYQIKGTVQMQINSGVGLSFSRGLRAMLRHDPDVIMVGEVRDTETAGIAIHAALTGHLVFSTLHTNDAVTGITRLLDMGIEPFLVASSVEAFIAQRLVRVLCPRCKRKTSAPVEIMATGEEAANTRDEAMIFEPVGCEACQGTGYQGRTGIYEFLMIDDAIRQMIMARATAADIKKKAATLGFKTMRDHGWEKIKRGITTSVEVLRVTEEG